MDPPPYDRIEVRDDGYLWLINYKQDGSEEEVEAQQPLLLHSTAALLEQLHENRDVSNTADDDAAKEGSIETAVDVDGDVNMVDASKDSEKETEEMVAEASISNEGKGESAAEESKDTSNNSKNSKRKKKKKAAAVESVPPESIHYKHLERTTNLGDRIQGALMHIRMFKHDARKRRRNREDRRDTKVKALHHQRERLQKQKEQQKQQQQQDAVVIPAVAVVEDSKDGDFQVVRKVSDGANTNKDKGAKDDESVSSAAQEPEYPYVRIVRTFNSLRVLVPILRALVFHKDRNNKELVVGPKSTKFPTKGKASCWLLGKHVFDTTTVATCKAIALQLRGLLESFLPDQLALDILEGTLTEKEEQDFWCQDWLARVWVSTDPPPSINQILPLQVLHEYAMEDEKAKDVTPSAESKDASKVYTESIKAMCKTCDERFFQSAAKKDNTVSMSVDQQKSAADQKQYEQAVEKLHNRIATILQRDFPGSRLSVYGSCLSNLSLNASDVDLSLFLPEADRVRKSFQNGFWSPARYEKEMSKLVRDVWKKLMFRKKEFADMVPVTRARVPVVKGSYLNANNPHTEDGSLHFDICFLNDIAVANSSLLREYSIMDESVRELMIAVKRWAKDNRVCAAQDNTLSSYAWMCMVIFYLQCISYVPNLQCPKLMEKAGIQRDPENYWHNVNDLDTCYLTWEQVQKIWKRPDVFGNKPHSCTALLYGFFHFYATDFARPVSMLSIKRGREEILPKTAFRKCSAFFCIEDPFETFDSHMPHDLGIPVNEVQCPRILALLQSSEEHLRFLLLGSGNDDDVSNSDEKSEMTPWPSVDVLQNTQAGAGKKKKKNRNNGGRGGRGGVPAVDQKQNEAKKSGNSTGGAQPGTAKNDSNQQKKGGQNGPSKGNNQITQDPGQNTRGPKNGQHNDIGSNSNSNKPRKGPGNNRNAGRGGRGGGGRGGGRNRGGGGRHARKGGGQQQQEPVTKKG